MANELPSDTVLDETPARALKFLGAAGYNTTIFAILSKRGYTAATHEQGWQLLLAASGYRKLPTTGAQTPAGREALEALDAWDEPNFRVARAALEGEFPAQADYVFADLSPQIGTGAIVSVTTFLDRRDALAKGRDGTAKEDKAAVKKLSERGITDEVCANLRKLLGDAVAAPAAPKEPAAPAPDADPAAAKNAKVELYRWYSEWNAIAHADIKRRDYLLQLGLATRKTKKKAEGGSSASAAQADEPGAGGVETRGVGGGLVAT